MADTNKQIARQFFERFDANDIDGVMELFSASATFRVPGRQSELRSAGVYDKDGIHRLFRRMVGALNGGLRMKVDRLYSDGDVVIAEAQSRGELKNGRVYEQSYLTVFQVADGKIAEVREYNDTLHAYRVWIE